MTQIRRKLNRTPIAIAAILIATSTAIWACSVPVCRYALERWRADSYEAIVFHDGDLSESDRQLVKQLRPDEFTGDLRANVRVKLVDVSGELPPREQRVWEQYPQKSALPTLSVHYPNPRVSPQGIWHTSLTENAIEKMFDSPLRQQIAEELVKGTSAVWVLLESGNTARDDAAEKLLSKQLAHLESTLEISKPDEQDIAEGLIDIDPARLELSFQMFRLSRDDPDEKFLVESLLNSEDDLQNEEFVNQPMAFPIFGRGRVLYALVGKGISNDGIREACEFLTGPCSCQVKNQNPGVDLLMAVNWNALVGDTNQSDTELPPLAGLDKQNAPAVLVPIQPGTDDKTTKDAPAKVTTPPLTTPQNLANKISMFLLGGVFLVIMILVALFFRR